MSKDNYSYDEAVRICKCRGNPSRCPIPEHRRIYAEAKEQVKDFASVIDKTITKNEKRTK